VAKWKTQRLNNVGLAISELCIADQTWRDLPSKLPNSSNLFDIGTRQRSSDQIKLGCGGRNACQRPLEEGVYDRAGAGAQEWPGRPLFAYVRENHAGVYAFVSMAGKCAS
jgi:hypothetical protein